VCAGGDQFFTGLGDYDFFVDLSPAYRLSWTPNKAANEISFMIQCRNSGWVGVGFSPDNGTMKNADIIMCRRCAVAVAVQCRWRRGSRP
jgi:hypothetical protein